MPINCPVLTFNNVIKLYPQKALEYIVKGLGELWVHLNLEFRPGGEGPRLKQGHMALHDQQFQWSAPVQRDLC